MQIACKLKEYPQLLSATRTFVMNVNCDEEKRAQVSITSRK